MKAVDKKALEYIKLEKNQVVILKVSNFVVGTNFKHTLQAGNLIADSFRAGGMHLKLDPENFVFVPFGFYIVKRGDKNFDTYDSESFHERFFTYDENEGYIITYSNGRSGGADWSAIDKARKHSYCKCNTNGLDCKKIEESLIGGDQNGTLYGIDSMADQAENLKEVINKMEPQTLFPIFNVKADRVFAVKYDGTWQSIKDICELYGEERGEVTKSGTLFFNGKTGCMEVPLHHWFLKDVVPDPACHQFRVLNDFEFNARFHAEPMIK